MKLVFICEDFLNADEEKSLFSEIEPYIKRLRYQFEHWDDVRIALYIRGSETSNETYNMVITSFYFLKNNLSILYLFD